LISQRYTALALLAFIGVACISSAHAHAPAPAPVHHKPIVVKECHDVCKDKCFDSVEKKCIDVPYQEQVGKYCETKQITAFVVSRRQLSHSPYSFCRSAAGSCPLQQTDHFWYHFSADMTSR
jgi:hypothetical protein